MSKPKHYDTSIDPLTYMKANMSSANYEGFLAGNVLKYISRYPKKNGLEDLEKAAVYLNHLIEFYKETGDDSKSKTLIDAIVDGGRTARSLSKSLESVSLGNLNWE